MTKIIIILEFFPSFFDPFFNLADIYTPELAIFQITDQLIASY